MIQQRVCRQLACRNRASSPERWRRAAERAIAEGVGIRQVAGTGQWVATSGSDTRVAYGVEVTGNMAHGCECHAGANGDPVCKHRAAFFLLIGAIVLAPEPALPAPGVSADCPNCNGCGVIYDKGLERAGRAITAAMALPRPVDGARQSHACRLAPYRRGGC